MAKIQENQEGFYVSGDGTSLKATYRKTGDREIRPKEKKKKTRPKKRGPTPFQEVISYVNGIQDFHDGVGLWLGTDLDGNKVI